jgi:pimeloyl-ACP methyl ester carboxylesterase
VIGMIDAFAPILEAHDLVVFDQRGTGFGDPKLDCPELDQASGSTIDELTTAQLAAITTCRERFVAAGVNPSAYTTRANAADVDDLRIHLGYDSWHLFGVSYGTRLALDVERHFPGGVRSTVIDSVLPPQVDWMAESAPNALRSFRATFAGCAAQADCGAAYPALEATLSALVASLDQTPGTVTLADGSTWPITSDLVLYVLFLLSYSIDAVALLPEFITQFSEGRFELFQALFDSGQSLTPDIPLGMYLSIVCSEYAAFSSPAAVDASNAGIDPLYARALGGTELFDECAAWGVPAAPAAERMPVTSAIPTLVLAGGYDPVTPPAWSALAASTLSNAHYVLFQNQTHGAFTDACGGALLEAFWSNPSADPSSACPNRDRALTFSVLPGRLPAGASLSRIDVAALVPELVIEAVRRRIR